MKWLHMLTAAAIAASASVAAQDVPRDLSDMVGARAGQAEGELQRRGYRYTGGQKSEDRSYANWWNADLRRCVTIATANGRYASIVATPAPDCGQAVNARGRPGDRADRERSRGYAPANDLSRLCRGEAAARFDRRPSEITTALPIRGRNGSTVSGWFDREKGSTFFTCRFDADDGFLGVN